MEKLKKIYHDLSKGRISKKEALERIKDIKLEEKARGIDPLIIAAPVWAASPAAFPATGNQAKYAERHIIVCGLPGITAQTLEARVLQSRCVLLPVGVQQTLADRYREVAQACFYRLQALVKAKPEGSILVQIVMTNDEEQILFAGLSGLLKTVMSENPRLVGQVILTMPNITVEILARQLQADSTRPQESIIKYEQGHRYALRWQEIQGAQNSQHNTPLKEYGVYLITGGLGGLGVLFANDILQKIPNARIILTGRSALTADKQVLLKGLQGSGAVVEYRQVDLTNLDQVRQLIDGIQKDYQQLNGILHCAGMIADNYLLKKTAEEFDSVLQPKVMGTYNLDEASRELSLDFMVFFSSVASALGNAGQSDYAAANGFMDGFAAYRNGLVAQGRRKGRTVSINWPLWEAGGMRLDETSRLMFEELTGMRPLQTGAGLEAFYRSLMLPHSQTMVMEGDLRRLRQTLRVEQAVQLTSSPVQSESVHLMAESLVGTNTAGLLEKSENYLREQFSTLLKLPSHQIDPQAPLEKYGIDSILAMNLTSQLEKTFGSLSKTLFFEYQTIQELAGYFIKSHSTQLESLFASTDHRTTTIDTRPKSLPEARTGQVSSRRFSRQRQSAGLPPTARRSMSAEPVAIVGLSGRYPEAVDIDAYWHNLRDGKDCIVEVPKTRWDWRDYFSEDRNQSGYHYSKWGGFITGVDEFDPRFFNISPREAKSIDPQERLFLQHVWMAVEDAGYTRDGLQIAYENDLAGQVGVYVGVMYGEYNLSGSLASIANRVSYVFNLHGPSMTLDTMCSSSLTAIHLACQDLKLGRTSLAIAGGVNVSIHPNKYMVLSDGQFISSDGHCQSFGEGGDGYIPGEGVGVVVLKRLSDAEREGDHIYGLIKGSALNHGGKTNGYTVPNPQAQASAINRALMESDTDPRHISYIEAHGTGTKLGDPIEITALSKAFQRYTQDSGFCLIGSAKSNIGHCESAAGIAGLTKVLLQMQHRQIVPSLHSEKLNPHIDFGKSPFVVNQTLRPWDQPVVDGRVCPRIAGISSFGAGGSNAHIIVEEYRASAEVEQAGAVAEPATPVIVPLSARTAEQLQQKAGDLLDFVCKKAIDLQAMAYTLQVGREAMEHRLGLVVNSIDQLSEKLRAYIDNEQIMEGVYQGRVKNNRDILPLFSADADLQETIHKWLARKKLPKLLDLWVKGLELDWHKLYGEAKPKRISLPTYPFARERYWIDLTANVPVAATGAAGSALHPLVHTNTSNFGRQSYSTTFSGEEPFLAEHHVQGQKVLPTVAYLEMARAAVENAMAGDPEPGNLMLLDTVWGEPVTIGGNRLFNIALLRKDSGQVDYEIYSQDEEQEIVHCQGHAMFSDNPAPDRLDLPQLQGQMQRSALRPDSLYVMFREKGLSYSPAYQSIVAIYKGDQQLLAEFRMRSSMHKNHSDYVLHPGMMDSVIQIAMSLLVDLTHGEHILLPSAVERIHVISTCPREGFMRVRYSSGRVLDACIALDLDLCDSEGNVCVQVRGLQYQRQATEQARLSEVAELQKKSSMPLELEEGLIPPQKVAFGNGRKSRFMSAEPEKPCGIMLAAPGTLVLDDWEPSVRKTITLVRATPLIVESSLRDTEESGAVNIYDHGKGVFLIQITAENSGNTLSRELIEELLLALDAVQEKASAKVLMISSSAQCFLKGDRALVNEAIEQKLYSAIVSFPCPVIAVMEGDAVGAGFLLASLCDFMICAEESNYIFTDYKKGIFPSAGEAALFKERFGEVLATDFLYVSTALTGKELRARGWSCLVLPQDRVEARAHQLASSLSAKSQEALRLLKRHLSRHIASHVKKLVPINKVLSKDVLKVKSKFTPSVEHVQLETHAEKVLVIRRVAGKKQANMSAVVADLTAVFGQLGRSSQYGSVVFVNESGDFLGADEYDITEKAIRDLQALIVNAPVPVIAALSSGIKDAGWLMSLFCDMCIYCEKEEYSFSSLWQSREQAKIATMIFTRRFGDSFGKEILLTGSGYSGRELQQRLGALYVTDRGQVLSAALHLARSWSRLPLAALADWKKEMALEVWGKLSGLPAWLKTKDLARQEEKNYDTHDAPRPVALTSNVITATVYPDGVLEVKMADRQAKNMFSDLLVEGLIEVFTHIEKNPTYKVVVLSGYDSYFASGGTRETLLAIQAGQVKFTDSKVFQLALDCKLPVIAAMQGHGIGAGWCLGMFADFVLLSEESKYVSPYMSYGFTPGAGATFIFPGKIGYDLGRETLFTAEEFSGSDLKNRGLPFQVLPRAQLAASALTLAKKIAKGPRDGLIAFKHQFVQHVHQLLEETYTHELAMHEKTFVGQSGTLEQIRNSFYQEGVTGTSSAQNDPVLEIRSVGNDDRIVTESLKRLLAHELHMKEDEIEEDAQFIDLGLDSITGVTWVRKINEKYGISIDATKIYSLPTLAGFSRFVKQEAEKHGALGAVSATPAEKISHNLPVVPEDQALFRAAGKSLTSWRKQLRSSAISGTDCGNHPRPIAVIGMAGQFPQANNLEEFWRNIAGGKDCISEVSQNRWDMNAYYHQGDAVAGKTNCKWMGALEEYDLFDPLFFNISPTDAESMDPQQRVFLQTCWHSIESAGYNPHSLSGSKCGVFVGCANGDYHLLSREQQLSAQGFTGAANSILAARISYFLNLQGPCISIDTACSSSLVAIANACDSLTAGGSDMALAGGVYVMAGPEMLIKSSQAGMLSPDGRCFAFDQRANGFVPGEGVGVVMLKRLADAEKAEDIIHGIIQGWGINQDGKTNGITAPNAESQTRLQRDVYDKFRIDPGTIQLIETHGTGTKLGDPIEIEGLKKSFENYTREKGFCALGSVKSNIGHCLTAAGVAGVIKLVLSLKHKQLPPTINFDRLNEHISLGDSPFYINCQLQEWELQGAERRHAAISSFGFSGTNAHMVIAEYLPPAKTKRQVSVITQNGMLIVVLSAKTVEQLKQKARDLLDFIHQRRQVVDLLEMAYTLQIGREAMDERLGFMVSSVEQLVEKLQAYIDDEQIIKGAYRGKFKNNKDGMSIISQDDYMKGAVIDKLIADKNLSKLLDLWVKGLVLDWNKLYGDTKPSRISLPTYPFAKERYWITSLSSYNAAGTGRYRVEYHPLLHRNTSNLNQQCYSSTFSGEEFFLKDHRVRGRKMLPAAAGLEMARAAVEHAVLGQGGLNNTLVLQNIIWAQPVVIAEPKELTIALFADDNNRIDYEIYSRDRDQEIVHCQGRAVFMDAPAPAPLDIGRLSEKVGHAQLEASKVYAAFTLMGLQYGPAHRGIIAINHGERQLLAKIRLPELLDNTEKEYGLHPSIIDSAMQACLCLFADIQHAPQPLLPVALDSLYIVSPTPREILAWVRYSASRPPGEVKLDIDLCDQEGNICVQMKGLSVQPIITDSDSRISQDASRAVSASQAVEVQEAPRPLFFQECWEEQSSSLIKTALPEYGIQTIIFADMELQEMISSSDITGRFARAIFVYQAKRYQVVNEQIYHCRFNNLADIQKILAHVIVKSPAPIDIIYTWAKGRGEAGIHALFNLFKAIKASAEYISHVTLIGHYDTSSVDGCWDYSWIGFERSLKLHLPNLKLLLFYTNSSPYELRQLTDLSGYSGVVWCKDGRRFILSFKPFETTALSAAKEELVIKQNGTYLITGGCGALGLKFARYLAESYQAKLMLLGRRPLSSTIKEQINSLKQAGAKEVLYHSVDISNQKSLTSWAEKFCCNDLSGIIHAAGAGSAGAFYEKTKADINGVLRPKSTGTMLLDDVLGRQPLDFVCYFSSSAAVLGDIGSCDYAVANRFQMAYAYYRQQKKCSNGKAIVINWPLWKDGRMSVGDSVQTDFYLKSSGQEALDSAMGVNIWHDIIRSHQIQSLVMIGNPIRVNEFLSRVYKVEQRPGVQVITSAVPLNPGRVRNTENPDMALDKSIASDLRKLVSASSKIAPDRLDDDANLADYGFDSINLAVFSKRLTAHFSLEITPAIFFSYATIRQLVGYFVRDHYEHMHAFYNRHLNGGTGKDIVESAGRTEVRPLLRRRSGNTMPSMATTINKPEPIAIIGMSGRFPQARTVDQLWTLLEEGKSAISEIPSSRWSWNDYFTVPRDANNKISSNKGGFIEGIDEFDPLFFEISPREAEVMDPSARLLLMEAYSAIEDAGLSASSLRGSKVGVFLGMEESQYGSITEEQGVTTSGNAMVSSRLSYYLDLHGPAIVTNTACSSGLVALHQAATSLRQGECSSALVAGVSLTLSPVFYMKMSQAGMLSADGYCYSFSKNANGISVGEAVVVLMLKPLSAAIAAGHDIYGVIKASGINFDGKTNGVTAPNGRMQEELVESIYTDYNINARNVTHIVAHGTGTKLGDPVELNALHNAFKKLYRKQHFHAAQTGRCAITSCKANLGHTMAASGLVSVVGLLKGMQHRKIPASLYCERENDYIAWEDSPFYINKTTQSWKKRPGQAYMGGVSAFGRSGTNAHVVIEEYLPPAVEIKRPVDFNRDTEVVIVLSARTEEQLQQRARDLLDFIGTVEHDNCHGRSPASIDLTAMAYTLQVGREAMDERLGFIVDSIDQLIEKLKFYVDGARHIDGSYRGRARRNESALTALREDGDMQRLIEQWIADRKLPKLLDLWVKGLDLDWCGLYGEVKPGRIRLPTYPFAKKRYWADKVAMEPCSHNKFKLDNKFAIKNIESIEDIVNKIDSGLIETNQAVRLLKILA